MMTVEKKTLGRPSAERRTKGDRQGDCADIRGVFMGT
jgi:hypothetical protein